MSRETVNLVRQCYERRTYQAIRIAGRNFGLVKSTVWKVLRNKLFWKRYRLQLLQKLNHRDYEQRNEFCNERNDLLGGNTFFNNLVISDEATFHLSGKVNKLNFRIWASKAPHVFSSKLNIFCAVSKSKVYGQILFAETTVTGILYLDMLYQWLFSQLEEDLENLVFQQDGASPHWHMEFEGS